MSSALPVTDRGEDRGAERVQRLSELFDALARAEAIADTRAAISAYSRLGLAYGELGLRAEALDAHYTALRLARRLEHADSELDANRALAVTLRAIDSPDEAARYARRALEIARQRAREQDAAALGVELAACQVQAADLLARAGRTQAARERLERELPAIEAVATEAARFGDRGLHARGQGVLGRALARLGRATEALAALGSARELARGHGLATLELELCAEQGALEAAHRSEHGRRRLREAAEGLVGRGAAPAAADAFLRLSEVEEAHGESASALAALRRHVALREQRLAEERELRVEALEMREAFEQRRGSEAGRLALYNRDVDHAGDQDVLTGLPTRRAVERRLDELFGLAQSRNLPLALAILDVDDLRQINEGWSQDVGDAVLQGVGEILRRQCREGDVPGRLGGDDFALVMRGASATQAVAICERVRQAVARHDWSRVHPGLEVTLSIGLADNAGADSGEAMLGHAAESLGVAKSSGRNRVTFR